MTQHLNELVSEIASKLSHRRHSNRPLVAKHSELARLVGRKHYGRALEQLATFEKEYRKVSKIDWWLNSRLINLRRGLEAAIAKHQPGPRRA